MAKFLNSKKNAQVNNIDQQGPWLKDSFAHCVRPIYIISRVFGLMPFSITFHPNGEVQKSNVSKFNILWFVSALCLLFFGIFLTLRMPDEHSSDSKTFSIISVLGDTGILLLGLIAGSLAIVLGMCNRHKLINIIKRITIFDKEARAIQFH